MESINLLSNLSHNAEMFAKSTSKMIGGSAKGQSMSNGMEALIGGFILVLVGIYLVSEGRVILSNNEADLESVDVALFGVVFIVLVAGIALWAWSSMT